MKTSLLILLIIIICDTVFGVVDHIFIYKDYSSKKLTDGLVKHITMLAVILLVYLLGDLPSFKFLKSDINPKTYQETINGLMTGIVYVIGAGQGVSLIEHITHITGYQFKSGIIKQEGESKNDNPPES